MHHPTQSFEVLTSVGNLYPDLCPRWQGFHCVYVASEQAQIARPFTNLSLRLHIRQFDTGMERITARSVALKPHVLYLPGSLSLPPNAAADPRVGTSPGLLWLLPHLCSSAALRTRGES